MIVIDDMLSSGDSILEVAKALKKRKARRVFIFETFGMFTGGIKKFDDAYELRYDEDLGKEIRIIDKIITTNLIYQKPELKDRPWYVCCGMSKYLAYLIDTLNHDSSISDLLDPREKIWTIIRRYNAERLAGRASGVSVADLVSDLPSHRSVCVCALSRAQATLIEDLLLDAARDDPSFEHWCRAGAEPVVVTRASAMRGIRPVPGASDCRGCRCESLFY